jgi:hypothetical protein
MVRTAAAAQSRPRARRVAATDLTGLPKTCQVSALAQDGPEQGQPGHRQQDEGGRFAEDGQAGHDAGEEEREREVSPLRPRSSAPLLSDQRHSQRQQRQRDKRRAQPIDVEQAGEAGEEGVEGEQ